MTLDYSGLKWIEALVEKEINYFHRSLEAPGLDIDSTNMIRGRIQGLRYVLDEAKKSCGGDINEIPYYESGKPL